MAHGDDRLLAMYRGPGVVDVRYGDYQTVGILDEGQRPMLDKESGQTVMADQSTLRFVLRELPTIAVETDVTVDGRTWRIRQVTKLNRLEAEAVVVETS
jgi:hypothetical protein